MTASASIPLAGAEGGEEAHAEKMPVSRAAIISVKRSAQTLRSICFVCADCAKGCAIGPETAAVFRLDARKNAFPNVAQGLHNPFLMNTTTFTTETFAQDITQLYTRYRNFVARVCLRYVQNRDEADDLAQEVFLKAGNAWQTFAGQSQASTWLYRIAVNHCLDSIRQRKRQRDVIASYAVTQEEDSGEENKETPSTLRYILECLRAEMDPVDGQIVYLRFELGLTHDAIAEIRGVSRVAITKRLTKIETRARELYAELEAPTRQAA
jgi:RNA polymerase sigma factor (sigma-70 family)